MYDYLSFKVLIEVIYCVEVIMLPIFYNNYFLLFYNITFDLAHLYELLYLMK